MSTMSPEDAKAICHFFLETIKQESEITKKVVRAVPDDQSAYKPHPTSMSAHELAWHLVSTEVWFLNGILKGEFVVTEGPAAPANIQGMLDFYDSNMSGLISRLAKHPAESLANIISFFGMEFPGVVYLSFLTHHSAHHRGQLSTYLRPMGAKVPSIYGGSADEPFQMAAEANG